MIAQAAGIEELIGKINKVLINPLIELLIAVAFVYFIYGLVVFLSASGDEAKRKTGKSHMVWGIVGLTIMFSAFGIINLLIATITSI